VNSEKEDGRDVCAQGVLSGGCPLLAEYISVRVFFLTSQCRLGCGSQLAALFRGCLAWL